MNLKNYEKDTKKNNILVVDSCNRVESSSYIEEKIVCTIMWKEVNPSSFHPWEENDMTKLFHIKIQVKKTKVDAIFDFVWHTNLTVRDLASQLGLGVHDNPHPHPLGWINKDVELMV